MFLSSWQNHIYRHKTLTWRIWLTVSNAFYTQKKHFNSLLANFLLFNSNNIQRVSDNYPLSTISKLQNDKKIDWTRCYALVKTISLISRHDQLHEWVKRQKYIPLLCAYSNLQGWFFDVSREAWHGESVFLPFREKTVAIYFHSIN